MRKIFCLLFIILAFFVFSTPASADFSDTRFSTNKFGIHVTQIEDLPKAAQLVNSNGGDWGYVTVVIPDNDQNINKWQSFFDTCRRLHLIPLVRIATHTIGAGWIKPQIQDLKNWAGFLDSLNWPTQTRFVLIYNEPNHDKEWGGQSNPKEYAQILNQAVIDFKTKSPDFFILNAALDQASLNGPETMDEVTFLEQMNVEIPGIFNKLDGWNSHSYPNLGFVGKPWETGRATIVGYDWELQILRNLSNPSGLKNLPVFITETGWPHTTISNFKFQISNYYQPNLASEYLKQAFENVWLNDNRVVAVTPFILNYPVAPFTEFSWLDSNGNPYPQFSTIASLTKSKGQPQQIEKYEVVNFRTPFFLPTGFSFEGKITLRNTGQSIWGEKPFKIKADRSVLENSDLILPNGIKIEPGQIWSFNYFLKTPLLTGNYQFGWENLPTAKLSIFHLFGSIQETNPLINNLFRQFFQIFY